MATSQQTGSALPSHIRYSAGATSWIESGSVIAGWDTDFLEWAYQITRPIEARDEPSLLQLVNLNGLTRDAGFVATYMSEHKIDFNKLRQHLPHLIATKQLRDVESCLREGRHPRIALYEEWVASIRPPLSSTSPHHDPDDSFDAPDEPDEPYSDSIMTPHPIDFEVAEDVWAQCFADLLFSSSGPEGVDNASGSTTLCALARALNLSLHEQLQPWSRFTHDQLQEYIESVGYQHFRNSWSNMRSARGGSSLNTQPGSFTQDDIRCLISYLTESGEIAVALDLVVVEDVTQEGPAQFVVERRPCATLHALIYETHPLFLYHSCASKGGHWESIGDRPSGNTYKVWRQVFDGFSEKTNLSETEGSHSVASQLLSDHSNENSQSDVQSSIPDLSAFRAHEQKRLLMVRAPSVSSRPGLTAALDVRFRYHEMRRSYDTLWTSDIDFIFGGLSSGDGVDRFGQWDTHDGHTDRPEISVRLNQTISSASHIQLAFGRTTDGQRATLTFPLETTELDRTGLSGSRDNPMTAWNRVKRFRSNPKWSSRIPLEFRTDGMKDKQGCPAPSSLEYIQMFVIRTSKATIASANLTLLEADELRGAKCSLGSSLTAAASDAVLEILCLRRVVLSGRIDKGERWTPSDKLLDELIKEWSLSRSKYLQLTTDGTRPPYSIQSSQHIDIDWSTVPCHSKHIWRFRSEDRRCCLKAITGNFSVNDLLHRKIGGVIAEVAAEYESVKDLAKVEWNCWSVLYRAPADRSSARLAVMMLRPMGKSGKLPQPESTVHITVFGLDGLVEVAAMVLEPLINMQSGDILLQFTVPTGVDVTSLSAEILQPMDAHTLWTSLMSRECPHKASIQVRDASSAHACVLEALSTLSYKGHPDNCSRQGTDQPALVWDGEYHPGLLRLAACQRSHSLLDGTTRPFVPAHTIRAMTDAITSDQSDTSETTDLVDIANGLETAAFHPDLGCLVALVEGWAGSGKTRFLALLIVAILHTSSIRVHLSAPANIPIDEAMTKIFAMDAYFHQRASRQLTPSCKVIVRGYTEAVEWKVFHSTLQTARTAYAGMDIQSSTRRAISAMHDDAHGYTIHGVLWESLRSSWEYLHPDIPSGTTCSLSQTLLRSIGLASCSGGQDTSLVNLIQLTPPWAASCRLLLQHVLAFIRGTTVMQSGGRPVTLKEVWMRGVRQLVDNVDLLATTPVAGCSSLYRGFRPQLAVYDEANKGSMADWLALNAHLKSRKLLLCGDRKQLLPSAATGLQIGYLDSAISPLHEFASKDIPVYTIYTQRRAAYGLVDAAVEVFYDTSLPVNYIAASRDYSCSGHWLTPQIVDHQPPLLQDESHPLSLFNPTVLIDTSAIKGGAARTLRATSSTTNLLNIHIIVGIIKKAVKIAGLDAADIAIVCGYTAQLGLYRQALHNVMVSDHTFKSLGIDLCRVRTVTIDKCEGADMRLVLFDITVTHAGKFMDNKNRLLVAATRARDFLFVIGQVDTLERSTEDSPIRQLHRAYSKRDAVYRIPADNLLVTTDIGHLDPGRYEDEEDT